MDNSDPLQPFGIAIVIVLGLFIVIPYLRRKTDLPTCWNALLLGLISFTGIGSVAVKYSSLGGWLEWFQPTAKEVQWYMLAITAFIVTLLAAYYLNLPAKTFAQKQLRTWPELSAPLTIFVLGFCFVVVVASVVFQHSTFLGPVTINLAVVGVPAACVFSFELWRRHRLNFFWLMLFIAVMMTTSVYAMIISGGRRLLLSLFLGPLLCLYWSHIRYWRPSRSLMAIGLGTILILAISVVYSNFRWYNLGTGESRTASGVIKQLRAVASGGNIFDAFLKNQLQYLSQDNGQFSLLTERYVAQRELTPVPLNTLLFLISYPVPHRVWKDKPEVVGLKITRDVVGVSTNWGIGIAGHGAYEGGILALMLYAVLLAFFMRILDEPLQMQPGNPFLIYIQAGAIPQVMGIPRGDLGIMTKEAIQCILFAYILGLVCRLFFGARTIALPAAQAHLQYRFPPGQRVQPTPRARS